MADLLKADGTTQSITPKDGKHFQLEELQGYVGGYIEIRKLADGRLMVLNEMGKWEGLPLNEAASVLYNSPYDYVVGDVVVCNNQQIE